MTARNSGKLFTSILMAIFLTNSFFLFGQTRRGSKSAVNQTAKATGSKKSGCNGGWSGIVTLTKTLIDSHESDNPGIRKDKDRIKHKKSRNYKYEAKAVVDGNTPPNPIVKASVNFTDKDLNWGEERVWDACNSRESGHWFIIEGIDNRETFAQATGDARSFYLGVDEAGGTYNFNIAFPQANGTYKRVEDVKKSGHCQAKNNEPFNRTTNEATRIDGESFSIYNEKIDPNNPDTITGSKIWGDDGKGQVRGFVYKATWTFTRCPAKILITDLKFEHPKFPDWNNWQEITEQIGTTDGNPVKITAKVLNMFAETKFVEVSLKETFKGDKWNGGKPDDPLPEGEASIRLEAGEEREVEFIFDTEGHSWFDDGRPHLLHRIKAEVKENGQKKDEREEPLNIVPKPVVLVHGLWSSADIWNPLYQNLLTLSHSYEWKAYPVGEKPEKGKMNMGGKMLSADKTNDIYQNADELAKYVRFTQEDRNAWHVDMVAHSMGGLVARLYIHKTMDMMPDGRPLVKHLVMLGTPNAGSVCAEKIDWKFRLFSENVQAIKDLKPESVALLNQYVKNRKGVKFSALAGNPIPIFCEGYYWNDGVVTVESAIYGVTNFAYSNDIHTDLTDTRNFGIFVFPNLVTGPKGTYPIPVRSDPTDIDKYKINGSLLNPLSGSFVRASFGGNDYSNEVQAPNPQDFVKELKLAPKQTIDIEMPVVTAANLGVTFLADESVSVSLVNDKGVVVAKNLAGTPLAKSIFRSVYTKNAVTGGIWKLRIENTSDAEQIFMGYSWSAENLPPDRTPVG